jgi:hypothetical protein
MLVSRWGRSAALSFVLVWGLASPVRAGHLFHGCHADGCDTTVNLPPQRVTVEAAPARVSVQETMQVSRGFVAPVMGAVYMPVAMPVMGFGVGVTGGAADTSAEDNPLRSVHAAELAQMRHTRAHAAARAEVEAAARVLARSAPADAATLKGTASTDLDQRIKDLSATIDKFADRLSAVERLTLIHDNYLRDLIQKGAPVPSCKP